VSGGEKRSSSRAAGTKKELSYQLPLGEEVVQPKEKKPGNKSSMKSFNKGVKKIFPWVQHAEVKRNKDRLY